MKTSAIILTKNDNYGGNLHHRAKMCINSLVENFDEVVVVDWKTRKKGSLLSNIIDELPREGKIKSIEVSEEFLQTKYPQLSSYKILESIGRNIGIRRASGDWIISTNIDIITTPFDVSKLDPNTFYTSSRRDVDETTHLKYSNYNELKKHIWENRDSFMDKPLVQNSTDIWSLVVCCGDFQIGTKVIWNKIKGFEENILHGCGIDSNIMKKASFFGKIQFIPYYHFHLNHSKYGEIFEGETNPPMSNQFDVIQNFGQTENTENWGLINENFNIQII